MGAVDKLFDNFEKLYEGYTDLLQTREVRDDTFKYLKENGIDENGIGHII